MLTEKQRRNFWSKVDKSRGCWLWIGAKNTKGYGSFRVSQKTMLATHVALMDAGRERPEAPNHHALHSDHCVSPSCVNPAHLRWGSNVENMADMVRVGRQTFGERNFSAKLTEEQAGFIRVSTLSQAKLMAMFGVSSTTITSIRRGLKWRHLEGAAIRAGKPERGETHSNARLTEAQALDIKRSTEPAKVMAEKYGVTYQQAWSIRKGLKWKHIG